MNEALESNNFNINWFIKHFFFSLFILPSYFEMNENLIFFLSFL
jgi:hypothetical protein